MANMLWTHHLVKRQNVHIEWKIYNICDNRSSCVILWKISYESSILIVPFVKVLVWWDTEVLRKWILNLCMYMCLSCLCVTFVDVNRSSGCVVQDMRHLCRRIVRTTTCLQSKLMIVQYHQEQLLSSTSMMCTTSRAVLRNLSVVLLVLWHLCPNWPPVIHWYCSVEMYLIHLSVRDCCSCCSLFPWSI